MKPLLSYITPRNVASFILVLFCIQYIPIESRAGVSYVKLIVSALCPLFLLYYSPKVSKLMILFISYYFFVLIAAILHPETLRWSTVIYLLTFIMTFQTFYNLVVVEQVFTKSYYRHLLEKLILAYTIVLIIQQCFIIVGIRTFPLINLVQFLDRGLGANSLTYEPSSAAIILSFAMLSLIRMIELDYSRKLSVKDIFIESKWPALGFLWCMLSMGSGSAFIGLGILFCYFIRSQYIIRIIIVLFLLFLILPHIEFEPLNRAIDSFTAFLTLDYDKIYEADSSAATRIFPLINTIKKLDLTTLEGWFGHGVDYSISIGGSLVTLSDRYLVGNISDYGFFSYIILQIIVYSCIIRKFFSIETIMWIGLGLTTLANVPINWGAMMMFTAVRYFQMQKENGCFNNHSEL